MIGLSQLISDMSSDIDIKELAENITTSSRRLANTLESMILLSQLVSDCYHAKMQLFNLKQLLDKVLAKISTRLKHNKIKCDIQIDNKLWLNSDANLLEHALYQILDNSIKFSPPHSTIDINMQYDPYKNPSEVSIAIIDRGKGISEQYINSLYTPFSQEDDGISRSFEGLGIGLSLVKRAMDFLDSEIEVSSHKRAGTMVQLRLSNAIYYSDADRAVIKAASYFKINRQDSESIAKLKILLIEDNVINAKLITAYLNSQYTVYHVSNGEAALYQCAKSTFQLILTDIHLGAGLNGIDTAKQLKLLPKYAHIPIIAISGYLDASNIQSFQNDCFTGFIAKPFGAEALHQIINEALQKEIQ